MTRISASVFFTPYSKLYILTELSAYDVKFISSDRQELDLSKYIYYSTVNSIFVEIQPDSTNKKNDPRILFSCLEPQLQIEGVFVPIPSKKISNDVHFKKQNPKFS